MKLVFLYGSPGVGKLTVAEALSRLTGYKVFHNHLTANIAHLLFEIGIHLGSQRVNTAPPSG